MSSEPVAARHGPSLTVTQRVSAWCVDRIWVLVVWGAMAGWSVALFVKAKRDYDGFQFLRFDLGNMVQAVWNTAHGRPLENTVASGEQLVRLGSHVDPILALLAPIWIVAPSPLSLVAVQIGAVALGALPVFWLGRRHLGSEAAAACVALSYLAYPWVAWTATDEMHPVTLAIPLLLFAVWFLDGDRIRPFVAVAVLAALCGELVGLTIAALGVWYAVARGRRLIGLGIATVGTGWSLVAVLLVVPAFLGSQSMFYGVYESVGGSPRGIVRTAFTDPGAIVAALTTQDDFLYLILLAVPLLGIFLFAPGLAAVALPQLLLNGLGDKPALTDPSQHYVAAILPFLMAATVLGLRRIWPERPLRGAVVLVVVSGAMLLLAGPIPGSPGDRLEFTRPLPRERIDALRDAVALVPDDVPVIVTNSMGSHLSARRYVYSAPILASRAEWAALDMNDPWIPQLGSRREGVYPAVLRAFRERIERSPEWVKVFEQSNVFVYRKAREQ